MCLIFAKWGLTFLIFLVFLSQWGCATKLVAVGEWGRPSDLQLNSESLAGVKISVHCGGIDREDKLIDRSLKICTVLERNLKELGAQIIPPKTSGADLTLWYLDRGVGEKRGSALSFMAFCFTFGFVPYISSTASEAELRVTDSRGVVLNRVPLRIEAVKALGWTSLATIVRRSSRKQQREVGRRFLLSAKNQMVSQALRLKGVGKTL